MKLLMLCLGNICRSPLAEGIMRSKLSDEFEIDSAGTIDYHQGHQADERSIKVARHHGIDISNHRARKITAEDFEYYDIIYCMDASNYENALMLAKNDDQRAKVSLILENGNEVPDPYYGDISDFEKVYQLLDEACERIAEELANI